MPEAGQTQMQVQGYAPLLKPQFHVKPVAKADKTKRHIRKIVKMSKRKDMEAENPWEDEFKDDDRPQFDVYFPAGHHIRVIGEKTLKRLGLHITPGIIDMNSGEIVPQAEMVNLEEEVARVTQRPRTGVMQA